MRPAPVFLLMLLLLTGAAPAAGQGREVSGIVRAPDGQPVTGAVVRVRGAIASVRTDRTGRFEIAVSLASSDVLVVSHPDFDSREIELQGRTAIDITLTSSIRYNQYGVPVSRTPLLPEARDGILVLESPDGGYRLWFDLRVNVDGALFFGDKRNPNGSGVEMRRARIGIKAQFRRRWYGEVDMDFADARADLKDAYLMLTPRRGLDLKWGNFKEVFSLEANTTSRYLTFLERPMVTRALAPDRRIGMGVSWGRPHLLLAGGLHFQDVGGWEEVQNRKDNNQDLGSDEGYSLTGKMILTPWYHDLARGLHLGVAASYRTPKTDDEIGAMRFDTRGPSNINRRKYLDTDRIPDVDHARLLNLEVAGYLRGLRVQGEFTRADVTRKRNLGEEHFNGFYVQGSALLFGGRYRYHAADGEFTQPALGRQWGDLEAAARYEYLDLDSRPDGVMGGAGEAWTFGINLYANDNVKFMLDISLINHDRYANGRGHYFIGTDAAGAPTTDPLLAVEGSRKAGEDYKALAVRVQVAF